MNKEISQIINLPESKVRQFLKDGLISPITMRDFLIGQQIKREKAKGRTVKDIILDVSIEWNMSVSNAYIIARKFQ